MATLFDEVPQTKMATLFDEVESFSSVIPSTLEEQVQLEETQFKNSDSLNSDAFEKKETIEITDKPISIYRNGNSREIDYLYKYVFRGSKRVSHLNSSSYIPILRKLLIMTEERWQFRNYKTKLCDVRIPRSFFPSFNKSITDYSNVDTCTSYWIDDDKDQMVAMAGLCFDQKI
jgi:hypothetical protein